MPEMSASCLRSDSSPCGSLDQGLGGAEGPGGVLGFEQLSCALRDFLRGLAVKNPPAYAGYMGSIPGSGRSPGEGNGNPLQYSCLESPMDRSPAGYSLYIHGIAESDMTERLSMHIPVL